LRGGLEGGRHALALATADSSRQRLWTCIAQLKTSPQRQQGWPLLARRARIARWRTCMAPQPPTGPRWRPAGPTATGRAAAPTSSKRGKVFGLLALLLALAGAVAAWLLFFRPMPEPFFLTLPIREYKAPQWPVNAFAVQDARLLLPRFKAGRYGFDAQTSASIQKELQALRLQQQPAIVVHLTCLARTYKNEVY